MLKKETGVLLLLMVCLGTRAQVKEGTAINTRLTFVKKNGKVEAEVMLQYRVMSGDSMIIGNLRDYYGTPGITKYMTAVDGINGTVVRRRIGSDSLVIFPANNEVNFTYTLAFDSASLSSSTYAPNTGANHLHFAFCQWMLPVANRDKVLEYHVRIGKLPDNWLLYSSASAEPASFSFTKSLGQAFSMIIGAGVFDKRSYSLKGCPLNIYMRGDFGIGNDTIASLAHQIVQYQHLVFQDPDLKFYSVALLPKPGNIAGINIPNMFLCHIKKEVDYLKLAWLISHEMQHRWVGKKVYIPDTTAFGLRHQWFSEGFDDYLAYVGLLDSKLFSEEDVVNSVNSYIRNIAENPYSAASGDSLVTLANQGKYGVEATKIAYYKGMLMGFVADAPFLEPSAAGWHSRARDLVVRLLKKDRSLLADEEAFFSVSDSMQLPLRELYHKHIVNGSAEFDLPASVFAGSYELKQVAYQVYDLGFNYSRKDNRIFITDVDAGGPAYKEGLRVGMEIITFDAVNRFSNAWCDCPVKGVVKNGENQLSFEYMPKGKNISVPQYSKK